MHHRISRTGLLMLANAADVRAGSKNKAIRVQEQALPSSAASTFSFLRILSRPGPRCLSLLQIEYAVTSNLHCLHLRPVALLPSGRLYRLGNQLASDFMLGPVRHLALTATVNNVLALCTSLHALVCGIGPAVTVSACNGR